MKFEGKRNICKEQSRERKKGHKCKTANKERGQKRKEGRKGMKVKR